MKDCWPTIRWPSAPITKLASTLPSQQRRRLKSASHEAADRSALKSRSTRSCGRVAVGSWCATACRGALPLLWQGWRLGHTKLTCLQQQKIPRLVADKSPDQLGLPGFLWTRALVAELTSPELCVAVTAETTGRCLRPWGSPRTPAHAAASSSAPRVRRRFHAPHDRRAERG